MASQPTPPHPTVTARRRWPWAVWLLRGAMLVVIALALWGIVHLSQLSTAAAQTARPVREGELASVMAARDVFGTAVWVGMVLCALTASVAGGVLHSSWRGVLARWLGEK